MGSSHLETLRSLHKSILFILWRRGGNNSMDILQNAVRCKLFLDWNTNERKIRRTFTYFKVYFKVIVVNNFNYYY